MEASTMSSSSKIGVLIVGLGGNNGVTLVAGHIANTRSSGLSWESGGCPGKGRVSTPNWGGCITQLPAKGDHGGVGFAATTDGLELAQASHAAVGGWDVRATRLGDALYESRILDYDLVRQVREEMNDSTKWPIMKAIYNSSFVGESQHATATHIATCSTGTTGTTLWDQVQHLRRDIRAFIQDHQVTGHTTVIWSASVERPADVGHIQTAHQLLNLLQTTTANTPTCDISPSMIYATAAALEGCSFVNGGSQNTLGPALSQLFEESFRKTQTQPAYLLGTDFKAGQTKFKTAVVEYLRALGLTPQVIASSNHLGNNDMLNLTNANTLNAKMRVKHSIFGPWKEHQLHHSVKVMYIPYMGDEKRDIVEYTSTGFLHQEHCMLTYTRCMDSILCVPLMIDAAVWCDYFARHNTSSRWVAQATAYLFKIPEGGADGVDPGFHSQMETLRQIVHQVHHHHSTNNNNVATTTTSSATPPATTSPKPNTKKMGIQELLHKALTAGIIDEDQVAQLRALVTTSSTTTTTTTTAPNSTTTSLSSSSKD